jgi:hypothetical protein
MEPLLSHHHRGVPSYTHPETGEKFELTRFQWSTTKRGCRVLTKNENGEVAKELTLDVVADEATITCTVQFSRSKADRKNVRKINLSYVTSEDLLEIWESV